MSNKLPHDNPEYEPPDEHAASYGQSYADHSGYTVGPEDYKLSDDGVVKPTPRRFDLKAGTAYLGASLLALMIIGFVWAWQQSAGKSVSYSNPVPELRESLGPESPEPEARATEPQSPPAAPSLPPKLSKQQIIRRVSPGVVFIKSVVANDNTIIGTGSGFAINADGYILTNKHVVDNADTYLVYFQNGSFSPGNLIATDANLDAALLKVPDNTAAIFLDFGHSDSIEVGEEVLALGFPLGSRLGQELTVTEGIVSSIRSQDGWFQISAAVNPGNSGGPLIRADNGEVIGLITAKIKEAENIGLARPVEACKNFVQQYTSF